MYYLPCVVSFLTEGYNKLMKGKASNFHVFQVWMGKSHQEHVKYTYIPAQHRKSVRKSLSHMLKKLSKGKSVVFFLIPPP